MLVYQRVNGGQLLSPRFMVVDGRIVMSGSLDWTYAAVERGAFSVSTRNLQRSDPLFPDPEKT